MNVFVLCAGRTGSTAFVKACKHITNYTCAHESRCTQIGNERLDYPTNHIEADNRLSWFLGGLDEKYGNDAIYVHLTRNREKTASSENKRWYVLGTILKPFCEGILMQTVPLINSDKRLNISLHYFDTVTSNIHLFMKGKEKAITVHLEDIKDDFKKFWEISQAEGDLEAALSEFDVRHNKNLWEKYNNSKLIIPILHIWRRSKLLLWKIRSFNS